jgi:F0F1-type ATP synthase membrane subunit c/vacuolar-type H+-ATPase subunit K
MAEFRTLKLSILADVDNLKKQLGQGEKEVQTFGNKIAEFGKKAALAFAAAAAAAGAYAVKLAVDGVKAAIEDEKAQESLRRTLVNVTGATEAQVAATEDFIEINFDQAWIDSLGRPAIWNRLKNFKLSRSMYRLVQVVACKRSQKPFQKPRKAI